jgi:hypothetical protein
VFFRLNSTAGSLGAGSIKIKAKAEGKPKRHGGYIQYFDKVWLIILQRGIKSSTFFRFFHHARLKIIYNIDT